MSAQAVKTRLHYFDMMKGVAIFMVVMGHVLTMCVREIDRAAIFKFVGQIHMPLFFFISGWFACRRDSVGNLVAPALGGRALRLLLPMVAVSSLWVLYFPHSGLESPLNSTFAGLWGDVWKNGYWFTLVLFELILIYAATVSALSRIKSAVGTVAFVIAVWAAMLLLQQSVLPATVCGLLSWELAAAFYPVFMFGFAARRFRTRFEIAADSNLCQTAAIVALCLTLYFVCWPWEFGATALAVSVVSPLLHTCLAVVAYKVFKIWSEASFSDGKSGRMAAMWCYIGANSLAVYLLHYFFLFPMGWARDWLVSAGLGFVPLAAFSAFWSALIVAAVLGLVKLLQPSATLSLLLTGSK